MVLSCRILLALTQRIDRQMKFTKIKGQNKIINEVIK